MAYVEISRLVKRFGAITAVDDVSFKVEKGEVLGFLGPNGAGKSTTMKIITGFLSPDGGTVTIGGDSIAQSPIRAKKRLGYLPEGAPLYGDMTCGGLLDFVAEVRGFRGAEKRRRVDETVGKVDLATVIHQPIETLSKGFKRRVGLAQAILHDPDVLILDEPTDGLDPNQKHEVRTLIRSMAADKVIVLSTHILEEVDAVCTRAVIIAKGRVISDGTPAELEARAPNHNSVSLTLRANTNADTVRNVLLETAGIDRIEINREPDGADDLIGLAVYPEQGQAIAASLGRTIRSQGWDIEELHVNRGRLDDVFRNLTIDSNRDPELDPTQELGRA